MTASTPVSKVQVSKHFAHAGYRQALRRIAQNCTEVSAETVHGLVAGKTDKPGGTDPMEMISAGTINGRVYLYGEVPLEWFAANGSLDAPDAGHQGRVDLYDGTVDGNRARRYAGLPAASCPPVIVAMSPRTFKLNIIDGGHRISAARMRGDTVLRCLVGVRTDELARLRHLESAFGSRLAPDGTLAADNFTAWFSDSQVVDAAGAPLKVFHGTWVHPGGVGNFTSFDRRASVNIVRRPEGMDAVGSWFSTHPGQQGAGKYGDFVYPVHVAMRNPIRFESSDEMVAAWVKCQRSKVGGSISEQALTRHKRNELWGDADRFIGRLKADGHDGIYMPPHRGPQSSEFAEQGVYIAFDPHQVKSALGNSGAFDAASTDMTDSHAFEVEQETDHEMEQGIQPAFERAVA